jgi:hypothetical protein
VATVDCRELPLEEKVDDLDLTLGGGLEGGLSSKANQSGDAAPTSGGSWPYSLASSEPVVVTELMVSKDVCRRKCGGSLLI